MLCLPTSLEGLLVLLAPCFTRPTFLTFRALVAGQVSQTGLRTVTGMLVGARLSGVWHHARAHRFFSHARWQPDGLGLRLLDVIVERLIAADAPLVLAVDDTLLHRLGRKVHATFWHHDATANSDKAAVAWGNNWVVVGVNAKLPFMARTVCLPVLFGLWQPRRKHIANGKSDPERPGKPELAREMVDLITARYPDRIVHVVGDAAYGSSAWRGLPDRVTLTVRPRKDAALYEPEPPRTGKRGRPALKGARLPGLSQIARDPSTVWQQITARRYGKLEAVEVHALRCLWHGALGYTPVQVILIRDRTKPAGYQLALLSTDLHATPSELIERYGDRWPIEVAFEEGKQLAGVGDARNRTQRAVERTVPFQFLCMTITILWYADHGHHPADVQEHRDNAPWYQSKANPSFADMLAKLRRSIIAAQYSP
ncbi:MAG: IS701 family transposase, partial [Solirubrobacteraceae bacterium]